MKLANPHRVFSAIVGLSFLLLPGLADAEILSVKSASANFRDKPHEASKIKYSADKYYPVEVLEKKSGWAKVRDFEGDEAWVSEKLLDKQATVVITPERVNIREQPNTTSDILFKVERGEVFKIEERKGDWFKIVDSRGDGGWIRNDMTWGDPQIDKKSIEADTKADAKAVDAKDSQAKEDPKAEAKEPEKVAPKADAVMSKLDDHENLEVLCRAFLENQASDSKAADKASEKKNAAASPKASDKKKADKKASPKNDKTKADKAAPKPKKADKKKAAGKPANRG